MNGGAVSAFEFLRSYQLPSSSHTNRDTYCSGQLRGRPLRRRQALRVGRRAGRTLRALRLVQRGRRARLRRQRTDLRRRLRTAAGRLRARPGAAARLSRLLYR